MTPCDCILRGPGRVGRMAICDDTTYFVVKPPILVYGLKFYLKFKIREDFISEGFGCFRSYSQDLMKLLEFERARSVY